MQKTSVQFLRQEDPWKRDRLPTPVFLGFPGSSDGKESACNAGDLDLIPGICIFLYLDLAFWDLFLNSQDLTQCSLKTWKKYIQGVNLWFPKHVQLGQNFPFGFLDADLIKIVSWTSARNRKTSLIIYSSLFIRGMKIKTHRYLVTCDWLIESE